MAIHPAPGRRLESNMFQYLDDAGDGTGNIQVTGDYSVTPAQFYCQPPANEIIIVHRVIVMIEDTSGFAARDYGNIADGLTNGIELKTYRDSVEINDLTGGAPIQTNGEWARVCYDVDLKTWGPGNEILVVRWSFDKSGIPVTLVGAKNESISIDVNDDMTGLIEHTFMVQGYK